MLYTKHPCFETCYCEGRENNGIEIMNVMSSMIYLIIALIINNLKKNKIKFILVLSLIILFLGSSIFHYYFYNFAAYIDILGILLCLSCFIIYKERFPVYYFYILLSAIVLLNLYFYKFLFISSNILPAPIILITFMLLVIYIVKYKLTNLQYIISIIIFILWTIDRYSNICVHWLFHILSGYIVYDMYIKL